VTKGDGGTGKGVLCAGRLYCDLVMHGLPGMPVPGTEVYADGLTLAGWVANRPQPEPMSCEAETLAYLHGHLPAPCLGELPWMEAPDPVRLAEYLYLDRLIEN